MCGDKGTVLCLTFNNFPDKDAGSVRLLAIAKAVVSAGYDVKVISMGKTAISEWQELEAGVSHLSLRNTEGGTFSLLQSYLTFNIRVNEQIRKIDNLKAIIVFNTMFYVFQNRQLKKLGIPLIYDSTEWYNACEFRQGILSPEYISNAIIVKQMIKKPWKVIAISSFLEQHYKKKKVSVKRIPAVMDVQSFPNEDYAPEGKIKVVYAGSPGKKDALYMIVQGVSMLPDTVREKFAFKIIGATKEQYIEQNGVQDIPENITFFGRLPRKQVIEKLAAADFTTFLRDNNLRFVRAGFPSKLAESMSMGVPVITNLTSDLSMYLKDGENAVIVDGFSSEAYAKALCSVADLAKNQIAAMHKAAKETAQNSFDYSNYVEDIESLITEGKSL